MGNQTDLKRARRIVIVSRTNGTNGALIGFLALVVSFVARDSLAVIASCGLCAGGLIELLGSIRAARHDRSAPRFLVASQCVALASVLTLAVHFAIIFSPAAALAWMPEHFSRFIMSRIPDPEEARMFLGLFFKLAMGCLALVALLYEGGMAIFYRSSKTVFDRPTSPPVSS